MLYFVSLCFFHRLIFLITYLFAPWCHSFTILHVGHCWSKIICIDVSTGLPGQLLYIDLRPGQTCHSKVMHRKEVTHSDGSYEKKLRRRAWLKKWDKVKIPWYTHRLMHRKRVTCELHDSYFHLMTIKHASPKTPEVAYSGLASHENRYWVGDWTII